MSQPIVKVSVHADITENHILIYADIGKSSRKATLTYKEAEKLLSNLKTALASLEPSVTKETS